MKWCLSWHLGRKFATSFGYEECVKRTLLPKLGGPMSVESVLTSCPKLDYVYNLSVVVKFTACAS